MILRHTMLIVFLMYGVLYAQDTKIVYEVKQDELGSLPYEELNPIPDFSILSRRYSLTLSGNKSKFSLDSMMLKHVNKTKSYKGRYTKLETYKNFSNGTFLYVTGNMIPGTGVFGKLDIIGQESSCRFELQPEYRVIAGFKCQKTVNCGGDEAWFTAEIPYVDSPLEEGIPVPGLVLLYRNSDYEIKAVDVSTGNYDFRVPKLKYVNSEASAMRMTAVLIDLGPDEAIIVDKHSRTGIWLKFPK